MRARGATRRARERALDVVVVTVLFVRLLLRLGGTPTSTKITDGSLRLSSFDDWPPAVIQDPGDFSGCGGDCEVTMAWR
jgi:hypothetical protein